MKELISNKKQKELIKVQGKIIEKITIVNIKSILIQNLQSDVKTKNNSLNSFMIKQENCKRYIKKIKQSLLLKFQFFLI